LLMTITWLSSYIISSPIKRSFRLAGWFFKMLTTSPGFSTSLCCVETILLMDTCPLDNIDFTEFLPLLCIASNKKDINSISIILFYYYFICYYLFSILYLITHILLYYNTFYYLI